MPSCFSRFRRPAMNRRLPWESISISARWTATSPIPSRASPGSVPLARPRHLSMPPACFTSSVCKLGSIPPPFPRRAETVPLIPPPHRAVIVDGAGREYPSSCLALAELGPDSAKTPLLTPLRPGESYVTDFVFDLPATISNPRLLVKDDDFVTSFVIGHEDSPFHKKVLFALNPANSATLRESVTGKAFCSLYIQRVTPPLTLRHLPPSK